jgi:hypothetical protein
MGREEAGLGGFVSRRARHATAALHALLVHAAAHPSPSQKPAVSSRAPRSLKKWMVAARYLTPHLGLTNLFAKSILYSGLMSLCACVIWWIHFAAPGEVSLRGQTLLIVWKPYAESATRLSENNSLSSLRWDAKLEARAATAARLSDAIDV